MIKIQYYIDDTSSGILDSGMEIRRVEGTTCEGRDVYTGLKLRGKECLELFHLLEDHFNVTRANIPDKDSESSEGLQHRILRKLVCLEERMEKLEKSLVI